jgi:nucleotide-binding universal stress UspA family protein
VEHADIEDAVLRVVNPEKIAADLSRIVQVPSITGEERNAVEKLGEMTEAYGLESSIHEHDLDTLRKHPDYPGEEAHREELVGLSSVLKGSSSDAPRVCLNGHIDVVDPGTVPWDDAERLVIEQWRAQALEAQEKALATLPDDVVVEASVVSGRDWEDALDSLAWDEGEVLVVGSSRLGPVARVFLGSNSTKLIRSSPVPVLVIPRGADVHLEDTASIPRVE